MRAWTTAALVLGLAAALLGTAPGAAQSPLLASLAGPDALAPGQVGSYNVTLSGGPSRANYSVEYYITGPDIAGGAPVQTSPGRAQGTDPRIRLNITAPPREQTITVVAKVTARSGDVFENETVEKAIVVITPIVLSATFRNEGTAVALNVTVRFYVDGALVGTTRLARIDGNSQQTATFNYLPVRLQPGAHTVRAEADLDGDGVINPARGEIIVTEIFYRETAPLSTGWAVLIGIAVAVPAFLVTVAARRRRQQT